MELDDDASTTLIASPPLVLGGGAGGGYADGAVTDVLVCLGDSGAGGRRRGDGGDVDVPLRAVPTAMS